MALSCVPCLVTLLFLAEFHCYFSATTGTYGGADDVLLGPLYQLGDFDRCVFEDQAKYCLAELHILQGNGTSEFWRQIKAVSDLKTSYRRDLLVKGVCVARNKTERATEQQLKRIVHSSATALGVDVRVNVIHCKTDEERPWTVADIAVGSLLIYVVVLLLSGTAFHLLRPSRAEHPLKQHIGLRVFLCFSLVKSWKDLTRFSNTNRELRCIQGIRAVIMIVFVLCHNMLLVLMGPVKNEHRFQQSYSQVGQALMLHGHAMLSVLFLISGFLATYNFINDVQKNNGFSIGILTRAFVNRYLRLTPAHGMLVLFSSSVLSRLSTGPTWHATVEYTEENCRRLWWTNLLYLNNYIGVEDPCLLHTWSLAADFQLYCVCLLLLALVACHPRSIKPALSGAMLLAVVLPFVQTYMMEELNPTILIFPETIRHLTKDPTYKYSYISAQSNLGPYVIGIITGYVFNHLKKNNIDIPKPAVAIMWVLPMTLPVLTLLSSYWYYQPTYQYSRLEAAFYASIYRCVYATGLATPILLCTLGHGGYFNKILSWKALVIFGRLGYCVYLVHFVLETVEVGITREPVDLGVYVLLRRGCADVIFSVILALILHLFVELPFTALRKTLFTEKQSVDESVAGVTTTISTTSHQETEINASFTTNENK